MTSKRTSAISARPRFLLFCGIGVALIAIVILVILAVWHPGQRSNTEPVFEPPQDVVFDVPTGDQAEFVQSPESEVRFVAQASIGRFRSLHQKLEADGYAAVDIEFLNEGDGLFVTAVYSKSDKRPVRQRTLALDMDDPALQRTLESQKQAGRQAVDLERYFQDGQERYAVIFESGLEITLMVSQKLSAESWRAEMAKPGRIIIDIDPEPVTRGEDRNSLIFALPANGQVLRETVAESDLHITSMESANNRYLARGYINRKIEPYNLENGDLRFVGVWQSRRPGIQSTHRTVLDLVSLLETDRQLAESGFELVDLGTSLDEGRIHYTGVWHRKTMPPADQ